MTTVDTLAKDKRRYALPPSLPPRGLSRPEAAAYIGVGPTTFDRLVADRLMPRPRKIYGRRVWDRIALDVAFSALSDDGQEDRADDVWSRFAV